MQGGPRNTDCTALSYPNIENGFKPGPQPQSESNELYGFTSEWGRERKAMPQDTNNQKVAH